MDEKLAEVLFAMSMLVAMVEKNRARIKEEDADTFYLDRNLSMCKKLLAEHRPPAAHP
jgi:hypothetical protein